MYIEYRFALALERKNSMVIFCFGRAGCSYIIIIAYQISNSTVVFASYTLCSLQFRFVVRVLCMHLRFATLASTMEPRSTGTVMAQ